MRFTADYMSKPATSLPSGKYRANMEWRQRPQGLPIIASAFAWQETARKSMYYLMTTVGHTLVTRMTRYLMNGYGMAISDTCNLPYESWHGIRHHTYNLPSIVYAPLDDVDDIDAPHLFRCRVVIFTNHCFEKQNIMEMALNLRKFVPLSAHPFQKLNHSFSLGCFQNPMWNIQIHQDGVHCIMHHMEVISMV
jgi:hypothetical protein